ncbi:hypothetical protein [Roseomonas harenae]|uniref:hypothetical protein n=1 Tax=Muricoccus harenae TaxID=2692566 RepID=UPI001331AF2C|nr:hypothetical protein [Roseomonas harenae]
MKRKYRRYTYDTETATIVARSPSVRGYEIRTTLYVTPEGRHFRYDEYAGEARLNTILILSDAAARQLLEWWARCEERERLLNTENAELRATLEAQSRPRGAPIIPFRPRGSA